MKTKVNVFVGDWVDMDTESLEKQGAGTFLLTPSESCKGWVQVGTADVEISFIQHADMVGKKLASLKEELKAERAEAQVRVNHILDKISKLEALTNDASPMDEQYDDVLTEDDLT